MVDSTIPLLKTNASWYRSRLRLSSFFAILNYYLITKKNQWWHSPEDVDYYATPCVADSGECHRPWTGHRNHGDLTSGKLRLFQKTAGSGHFPNWRDNQRCLAGRLTRTGSPYDHRNRRCFGVRGLTPHFSLKNTEFLPLKGLRIYCIVNRRIPFPIDRRFTWILKGVVRTALVSKNQAMLPIP